MLERVLQQLTRNRHVFRERGTECAGSTRFSLLGLCLPPHRRARLSYRSTNPQCKNLTLVKNTPNASHCARFWELGGSFTWTRRHRAEVPATKVSLNVLRETTAVWSPRAY